MADSPDASVGASVDVALWHPAALGADVDTLCQGALRQSVRAVCVHGSRVALAASRLEDSPVKTVALVGFPFGASDSDTKRYETEAALDNGAQEIEVVLHAGAIKDKAAQQILRELRDLADVLDERPFCVVVERALLSPAELLQAVEWITDTGADTLGIGTGFWPGPLPSPEEVTQWKGLLGARFALKITGNVPDLATAAALLTAGASRLGVAGLPAWLNVKGTPPAV
jgi:deoxyribose-phosphate aldolase